MDPHTLCEWFHSQFYNEDGYFSIVSLSQVIIAVGIIAMGLIYKPWKLIVVWRENYEKKRADAVHTPPLSRQRKKTRRVSTDLQLSLSGNQEYFGISVYNADDIGTAKNVQVFLDDIPFAHYPTRIGKARKSWNLRPQRYLVCWIDPSREPKPRRIRITCAARDGTEHTVSMDNIIMFPPR
jgi:hypothetical protein